MTGPVPVRHRAAQVAVVVAASLAASKLVVAWMSGSVAVLASGLDSTLDVVSSAVNWWAIHKATAPPDEKHRFGHGKVESLAGLIQAAFVGGSGVFVVTEAVKRLREGGAPTHIGLALAVVGLSTLATIALVLYQRREARRTGSLAVAADSAHYTSDVLAGGGVMLGVWLSYATGRAWIDPVVSLAVAAGIFWTGFDVARRSVDTLLDRALPAEELAAIERVLASFGDRLHGHHGLRTRSDGLRKFVEVHLEVDGHVSLERAHHTYVEVVEALQRAVPGVDLSIHLDPAGADDPIAR